MNVFNSFNRHIQFTIERETNNSVPFLDTKPIRQENGTIIVDWYQKPTNSGRYIHFLSNHPIKQKINLIIGLKNRIINICHPTLKRNNLLKLKSILKRNSYPDHLLNRLLFNTGHQPNTIATNSNNNDQATDGGVAGSAPTATSFSFFSLPLINDLTNKLTAILKTEDIKIAKCNKHKIGNIFTKLKDPLPKEKRWDVVYSVPCSNCDLVYIGQTSQQLKQRLTQHKSDITRENKICALATHCRTKKHTMNFENTEIVDAESRVDKRSFLEMVHIQKNANSMNAKTDTRNLSNIYAYLISKIN